MLLYYFTIFSREQVDWSKDNWFMVYGVWTTWLNTGRNIGIVGFTSRTLSWFSIQFVLFYSQKPPSQLSNIKLASCWFLLDINTGRIMSWFANLQLILIRLIFVRGGPTRWSFLAIWRLLWDREEVVIAVKECQIFPRLRSDPVFQLKSWYRKNTNLA